MILNIFLSPINLTARTSKSKPCLWRGHERVDEDAQKEALEGLRASDAMLMGRRTYEIFAGIWPARTGAYADRIKARDFDAVQVERRRVGSGVLVESFPPWRAVLSEVRRRGCRTLVRRTPMLLITGAAGAS